MSKIFKPRRGTTYTMRNTAKKSTVLAKGEMFVEVPNTGVGTGPSKIIIGDGVTTFENLPVALSGTTTSDVTPDTSENITAALNNVVSGKEMSNLFGSLKKAITLNQSSIAAINEKVPFTLFINNGAYGYKNSSGTFIPFKSQADIDSAVAAAKVGTATAAQVLTGYTFTNAVSSGINGAMANQGTKTYTINPGGSQTIPAGYHNGSGRVSANPNQNSGTYTPTTRTANIDMGANNTYRYVTTTSVPNTNSGTYNATTRSNSTGIDLGETNTYRYVRTDNVPNANSAEYVFPANDTGSQKDLGATNTYRYVTATNVYNKGKSDGVTTHSQTYTFGSGDTGGTKDLGVNHTYRYVNASNVYDKGKSDGVTTHTATYTYAGGDTGGTKDLGVNHTYRYVNAANVYAKGKADGSIPSVVSFSSSIMHRNRDQNTVWWAEGSATLEIRMKYDGYVNVTCAGKATPTSVLVGSDTKAYFNSWTTETKRVDFTNYDLLTVVISGDAWDGHDRGASLSFDWH